MRPAHSPGDARGAAAIAIGLAMVVGAGVASAQRGAPPPPLAVRAGVVVRPDTVRVGDPFTVTVGVLAPAGATIAFATAADSAGTVQSLDPAAVRMQRNDAAGVEQYATYRVSAWDVGQQPIAIPDVVVRLGTAERHVPVGGHAVFVRTVLPADSAQRVPKPPRPLYEPAGIPWWVWALVAVALAALGFLLWWWWRRRRAARPVAVVDPYARATGEFARIDALGLVEAGERGRFVALNVEVLRDYLAARYDRAWLSLTSTELVTALRGERAVPLDRLTRLLDEADLVKFARRSLSAERARELARETRAVVEQEHTTRAQAAAAAQAATAGRAA